MIYQDKPRLKTALEMLRTSMSLESSLSEVVAVEKLKNLLTFTLFVTRKRVFVLFCSKVKYFWVVFCAGDTTILCVTWGS